MKLLLARKKRSPLPLVPLFLGPPIGECTRLFITFALSIICLIRVRGINYLSPSFSIFLLRKIDWILRTSHRWKGTRQCRGIPSEDVKN